MLFIGGLVICIIVFILSSYSSLCSVKPRASYVYYSTTFLFLFTIGNWFIHPFSNYPMLPYPLTWYLSLCVYVYCAWMMTGKIKMLRILRFCFMYPAIVYFTATFFSLCLSPLFYFFPSIVSRVCLAISLIALHQTTSVKKELVTINITKPHTPTSFTRSFFSFFPQGLTRTSLPSKTIILDRSEDNERKCLRVIQLSDLHLSCLMTPKKAHKLVRNAVSLDPDLVVITGDVINPEMSRLTGAVSYVFGPLVALKGKVFAVLGNNDLNVSYLKNVYKSLGITLLRDREAIVETPAGPVQILGADCRVFNPQSAIRRLVLKFPPIENHFRMLLIHDPEICKHLPDLKLADPTDRINAIRIAQKHFAEGYIDSSIGPDTVDINRTPGDEGHGLDLILAGGTNGGHINLVPFCINRSFDVIRWLTGNPTRNLWKKGGNHLFIHRGLGVFGFPLRLNVPPEFCFIKVYYDEETDTQKKIS
ncbi:hypothetical protein GEMRC1_008121 [Eukaryota sp. GEM-RC1]